MTDLELDRARLQNQMPSPKPIKDGFGKPLVNGRGALNTSDQGGARGNPGDGLELYGGEVILCFDRARHRYLVTENGRTRRIPSVTQIISVIDKSGPLTQWAANCAIDYLRQKIEPGKAYDEIQIGEMFQDARFNFRKVSSQAKSVGALAHDWIARYLAFLISAAGRQEAPPLPVNEQARRACIAAQDWFSTHHFEPFRPEQMVYSRTHGYAGTLDFPFIDGRPSVIDWKTSAAIYPEYCLQLAAYAAAWAEMNADAVPDRWIVRLGKDDGEFEAISLPSADQDADFSAFLGAKTIFERLAQLRDGEAGEREG